MATLEEDISIIRSLHKFLNMIIHNIDTNQNVNEKAINKLAVFTRKYFESYEDKENENESDMEPEVDDDDNDSTDSLDFSNYQGVGSLFASNSENNSNQKELKKGKVFDDLINDKINNSNISRFQKVNFLAYNKFKYNSKFY